MKLYNKRLRARAKLENMWENPTKRALIQQVEAELHAANDARLAKRAKARAKPAEPAFVPTLPIITEDEEQPPQPTSAVDADTLLLRGWIAKAVEHVEALQKDIYYSGTIADVVQISGAPFSHLMLTMGKREANVKKLREWGKGALAENKGRVNTVIRLYQEGKIGNYKTAENLVERLASKAKDKRITEKTDREYNRIIGKYKDAESVTGNLTRERRHAGVRTRAS